jgi:L-asparaginase II
MIGRQGSPLLEIARGDIVESTHYGAIAPVESHGRLLRSPGDLNSVTR